MGANEEPPFLAGALKAPRISQSWQRLAGQISGCGRSREKYFVAVLETEINVSKHSGSTLRVKAAGFPAIKTLDEFTLNHRPGSSKDQLGKPAWARYLSDHGNVVFLGPPETRRKHLTIVLGVLACDRDGRVLFDTASGWVSRFLEANFVGALRKEPTRLGRYGVIIDDEVGYLPAEKCEA